MHILSCKTHFYSSIIISICYKILWSVSHTIKVVERFLNICIYLFKNKKVFFNLIECNLRVLRVCWLRIWLRFNSCTTLVDIESSSKKMIVKGWMWKSLCGHSFSPLFNAPTPWPSLSPLLLKIFVSFPLLFHPLLRYFRQSPLMQPPLALIRQTNLVHN